MAVNQKSVMIGYRGAPTNCAWRWAARRGLPTALRASLLACGGGHMKSIGKESNGLSRKLMLSSSKTMLTRWT
ncbi:hypothetical protein [Pseudophaeobacter arcticus]|uniref:hypothetical protein n=1 Tax=Pseudophaeobacter arcticus TaxID=385492 RepID=UPI0036D26861